MKQSKKAIFVILVTIVFFAIFSNFSVYKKDRTSDRQTKKAFPDSLPRLLFMKNIEDFFYNDNGYNIEILSGHTNNSGKRIKSITVYRYSTATQTMILQDSILLNKEGKPVLRMTPYDSKFSSTYYFYDNKGNRFLDITILENKYDTLYTLRRSDPINHEYISIQYNITRKELDYLTSTEISPVSDSIAELKLIKFEPDINYKKILPFESRNMLIKLLKDSLVNVSTNRIVYSDTTYNSTYNNNFRIKNYLLVPENEQDQLTHNSQGDWIAKKTKNLDLERRFSYYMTDTDVYEAHFTVRASVLNYLNSQMDTLPSLAWANYKKNQNSFALRFQQFENEEYGDSIEIYEGNILEAFLPKLWYQVSASSGNIAGIDSMCYVVGYNTPIKNEDDNNKRCLAIYEHRNGKYRLIKQSLGAIDYFNDADNDLLFDGLDETNFSVDIQEGNIIVKYEYMRGGATDEFEYNNGNWVLVRFSSDHMTCCQFESSSYDYKTKTYSSSVSSMGDDNNYESADMPRDTSITLFEDRPVLYMDSVTIKGFD